MPAPARSQQPRLLDEVGQSLRLSHYSSHTERYYGDWIVYVVSKLVLWHEGLETKLQTVLKTAETPLFLYQRNKYLRADPNSPLTIRPIR